MCEAQIIVARSFSADFSSTGTHSRSAEIEEEFHHVICCTWLRFKNSFSSNSQFCMWRYFSHVRERWRNRPFWRSGRTSQKNTLKNCVNLFFLLSSYFPFSHQFWNETAIRCGHNNRTLKNNKKKTHNSQIFVKKSELNFTLLMNIHILVLCFFRSSAHLGLGLGCYNEKNISYRAVIMNNRELTNWKVCVAPRGFDLLLSGGGFIFWRFSILISVFWARETWNLKLGANLFHVSNWNTTRCFIIIQHISEIERNLLSS